MQSQNQQAVNNPLSLDVNWLFSLLDPNKSVDRGEAMADILAIIILNTLTKIKPKVSDLTWSKLTQLRDNHNLGLEEMYSVLESTEKQVFLDAFINAKNETLRDYFSSMVAALPDSKQQALLTDHPELDQLKKVA